MDCPQTIRCEVFIRPSDPQYLSDDNQALYIDHQLVCYKKLIDAETMYNACNEWAGEGASWVIDLRVKNMDPGLWVRWPAHTDDV